ncbi:hypothetical protein TNIN_135791 [Trichonephila inaurata madagascariensis]|uniref:Uncharacterized protein n=1 Tax=Trichonephila inaurata madagascariensis TaxID=2747483 RepID=A0A8X7BZA6_9ARAC|nr:hypothetical protein TNIN_135791 [Trichonephila inaurata madagascariensis]
MVNAIHTRSQPKNKAEQKRTSEADEKEEMKLEENLAEDIENLLPSFTEEKDTKSLININTDELIKAQQESEELAPLIQKVENDNNNEAGDYSLTKGNLLIRIRKNKNGDELAIEYMEETKIKRRVWYDKNAIKREFSERDLVLVLRMKRPNKLFAQ